MDKAPSEAIAGARTAPIIVYANEPLMRLLAKATQERPTVLILGFYAFVTAPLFAMHGVAEQPRLRAEDHLSFLDNISWSLSVVFLLPFVVGLSLQYYQEIPLLFRGLFNRFAEDECDRSEFEGWLNRRFNDPVSPLVIAVATLFLNWLYLGQLLDDPQMDWMKGGILFHQHFGATYGLTLAGAFAIFVQTVLVYWVATLVLKGAILAWGLREFFDRWCAVEKIEPLHPDGVSGLAAIGRVAGILNRIFFLLGLYLSLKVIDKMIIQESSLLEDIGNPMMLGAYAILAPLLFFLPLAAAHDKMLEAKERFLKPICEVSAKALEEIGDADSDADGRASRIEEIVRLDQLREQMYRKILVWPFDFKSVQSFFATVTVPLLPIALSVIVDLLLGD